MSDREDGWAEVGEEGPVVRDRRRFNPTGERRAPGLDAQGDVAAHEPLIDPADFDALGGSDAGPATGLDPSSFEAQLAERTTDLQRVQAEYANYRRRVDRDRVAVSEAALATVMAGLLPVLDDIERARAHGEVTGGFGIVADGLETSLTKLGLSKFGDAGEPFDPTVHEALTHGLSADVTEAVCSEIYQAGYRVGERVLRPARVAVLEPEPTNDSPPADAGE